MQNNNGVNDLSIYHFVYLFACSFYSHEISHVVAGYVAERRLASRPAERGQGNELQNQHYRVNQLIFNNWEIHATPIIRR